MDSSWWETLDQELGPDAWKTAIGLDPGTQNTLGSLGVSFTYSSMNTDRDDKLYAWICPCQTFSDTGNTFPGNMTYHGVAPATSDTTKDWSVKSVNWAKER